MRCNGVLVIPPEKRVLKKDDGYKLVNALTIVRSLFLTIKGEAGSLIHLSLMRYAVTSQIEIISNIYYRSE